MRVASGQERNSCRSQQSTVAVQRLPRVMDFSGEALMLRKSILLLSAFIVCGFVGAISVSAFGQSATTGAIGGTIADQHGAILGGATVTVTNTATDAMRTAVTNNAGLYRITALEPGTYTVSVAATGFQTYKEDQIPVTVGGYTDISPKLTVGNVAETIEVTDQT